MQERCCDVLIKMFYFLTWNSTTKQKTVLKTIAFCLTSHIGHLETMPGVPIKISKPRLKKRRKKQSWGSLCTFWRCLWGRQDEAGLGLPVHPLKVFVRCLWGRAMPLKQSFPCSCSALSSSDPRGAARAPQLPAHHKPHIPLWHSRENSHFLGDHSPAPTSTPPKTRTVPKGNNEGIILCSGWFQFFRVALSPDGPWGPGEGCSEM